MATTQESPKPPAKAAADDPPMSPEGVPYQTSGFPRGEENPGPFDEGEGKNSPLLKANVEAAKAAEKAS